MQTKLEEKGTASKIRSGVGHVTQIIGPTVDIQFGANALPEIFDAIIIKVGNEEIVVETAQHLGNNVVRAVALSSTDGIVRGMEATNTGAAISVPVGRETLGRMFNVLGKPIDEKPAAQAKKNYAIHRPAPALEEREGA